MTDLRRLVHWLEDAGHQRIELLDNDSTWPELLDYYRTTPHTVTRLGANYGAKALWRAHRVPGEWFVYTDPDLLPIDECPTDAVAHLHDTLQRYPQHIKAGLGLHLADTPPFEGRAWEHGLLDPRLELEPGIYNSLIDTTFAIHRPNAPNTLGPALRLGHPYQCRHLPWYHLTEPTAEERHYLNRAVRGPLGSTWGETRT